MSARAWAAFATVSTLWGIPYLFIKIAVDDGVPPAFLAFVRVALGAAVLMALAWRAGTLGALRGRGRWLALYALFEIVVPFPLIAAGERHVASSLAAIIIAAVPLFVAVLALRFDHAERATGSRLVGLIVGLVGVVALVGIDVAGRGDELLGAGAILIAAVGYAAGPMVFKRTLADLDPRAAMGASLVVAAVALAPLAAVDPPAAVPSTQALVALVVLGIFCTAAAFVFFGALIAEVGPGRGARHHLRRSGRRGGARRHRPGRAPRRGRRGRAAAHTRGLVAVDRRAPAAALDGRGHPRARAPRGTACGTAFAPDERPLCVDVVLDNRRRLEELHRERTLAQMTPLAGEPAYMADLEDEILATEAAYVAGAITEIASLRARLGGRQWG